MNIEEAAETFVDWVCEHRPSIEKGGLKDRMVGAAWSSIEGIADRGSDPEKAVARLARSFSVQMPEGTPEKLTEVVDSLPSVCGWCGGPFNDETGHGRVETGDWCSNCFYAHSEAMGEAFTFKGGLPEWWQKMEGSRAPKNEEG